MHDSPDDEPTIVEVLSAFVREANNGENLDPPTGAINAKDVVAAGFGCATSTR